MREIIGGSLKTQTVYVVAKLGIPDQLSAGPRSAEDLAAQSQVHAPTLSRVLRFLAHCGVLTEHADGRFALAPPGESLQTAHPRSLRPTAIRAGEGMWTLSSRLLDAVRTGRTPYGEVHGKSFFDRDSDGAFAVRMSSSLDGLGEAIANLDCVKRARTIVDIGGGHGRLLAAVLQEHPQLRGVLFDRAQTIDAARDFIGRSGLAGRCELVAGDFFEAVPAGGDVYLLSWVLHDWDDERAARILRTCHRDGAVGATLLLVEVMLPPHAEAMSDKAVNAVIADPFTLDLQMLLLTGGRERTTHEFRALLHSTDYTVRQILPLASSKRGASLIEAEASHRGAAVSYE